MTARLGMLNLLYRVRAGAAAEYDEFSFAGETYFSNDHLQQHLDANRLDVYREALTPQVTYDDTNTAQYFDYYFTGGNIEEPASGSEAWLLQDSAGSAWGTADYTVNARAKHIRFAADTGGSAFYLTYRTYNVEMAIADVWDAKAANAAASYDVSTDNHSLKRSQKYDMYTKEASKWRARAISSQSMNASESYLIRSDVNVD